MLMDFFFFFGNNLYECLLVREHVIFVLSIYWIYFLIREILHQSNRSISMSYF